mgnify:CR=1 FL=1
MTVVKPFQLIVIPNICYISLVMFAFLFIRSPDDFPVWIFIGITGFMAGFLVWFIFGKKRVRSIAISADSVTITEGALFQNTGISTYPRLSVSIRPAKIKGRVGWISSRVEALRNAL